MTRVRDQNGRFIKGHPNQGAGRKPRSVEDDFISLMDGATTQDDWNAIIKKAVEQAKRGDGLARSWLADRRFGKAIQKTENENRDHVIFEVEEDDSSQGESQDSEASQ